MKKKGRKKKKKRQHHGVMAQYNQRKKLSEASEATESVGAIQGPLVSEPAQEAPVRLTEGESVGGPVSTYENRPVTPPPPPPPPPERLFREGAIPPKPRDVPPVGEIGQMSDLEKKEVHKAAKLSNVRLLRVWSGSNLYFFWGHKEKMFPGGFPKAFHDDGGHYAHDRWRFYRKVMRPLTMDEAMRMSDYDFERLAGIKRGRDTSAA